MTREQLINDLTEFVNDIPLELHLNSKRTAKLCDFLKSVIACIAELTEENERLNVSCTELTQCCTKLETLYKIESKRVDTVKASTVDAVEVVRCKDCKHYEAHGNGKYGLCKNPKGKGLRTITDYCSYGERR